MSHRALSLVPCCFFLYINDTVQLEGVFSFPHIPVDNKTEEEGLKFLTPVIFFLLFGTGTGANRIGKNSIIFHRPFISYCQ